MKITVKLHLIIVVAYVGVILWITLFSRTPGNERIFKGLFWEISNGYWKDIFLNILLFIPLGFLIGGKRGIFAGVVLSIGIELTQYIVVLGYSEIDDVLNNTIGSMVGVGINKQLSYLISDRYNIR